jgi:hypothetical protein
MSGPVRSTAPPSLRSHMSSDEDLARLEALLAEQAALRRVATMVAGCTPGPALFGRVCVSALGGALEIDSPVGAGTTIRARIPLRPPGEAGREAGADVQYAQA